ncbi:hypothetical protein KIN20_010408 [Parelaphostrongylus tenuis]|uniref:Uncharacterized protein n=1 Tax=Parelaphostrongylus tenuis TaxID=148309 RepID=A0AAD5QIS9_PARTN|nr:hypothetical protein KIN20_010408 [Parelaphostrongylus tenuis]
MDTRMVEWELGTVTWLPMIESGASSSERQRKWSTNLESKWYRRGSRTLDRNGPSDKGGTQLPPTSTVSSIAGHHPYGRLTSPGPPHLNGHEGHQQHKGDFLVRSAACNECSNPFQQNSYARRLKSSQTSVRLSTMVRPDDIIENKTLATDFDQ